jgi:aryl-phospho-beta-D-glucosidase BglC (GH1 family)
VQGSSSVFQLNICAENPPLRKAQTVSCNLRRLHPMQQIMIKKEIFRPTRNLLLLLVLLVSVNNIQAQAVWDNTSFVHRNGQEIHNGQNNVIKLDGVNLGAWLNWEGWMWGGGFIPEKELANNMQSLTGTEVFNSFRDSVYKNFITKEDIKKISLLGFNVVRIPFNHTILEEDTSPFVYKESGWEILDSVLKWCEDYNVYAVVDLHSAPGGASKLYTADADPINLWESTTNKNRTIQLWKAIASRYKNRGIIAAYDLLNEPNVTNADDLTNLYKVLIDSIRSVDSNHMIMLEGNNFAQDFSMFKALPDKNICFQFHIYSWFNSTNIAKNLHEYTKLSNSLDVPLWCGEWGENDLNQLNATVKILKSNEYKFSGNCFWTWKKMITTLQLPKQINFPYLVGISNTHEWDKVSTYLNDTLLNKPSAAETQQGINSFIKSIPLKNCTLNKTLLELLIQNKDTIYPTKSVSIKMKLPSFLSINGSSYPGMVSIKENNKYGFSNGGLAVTIPIFAKLKLGTLTQPIRFKSLLFSGSSSVGILSPSSGIPSNALYSSFLGLTYLNVSIKNSYIAGLYAFENANGKRFLNDMPNFAGLFLYSRQNNNGNTFIAGAGLLAFNGITYGLPVLGYIAKFNPKWSLLMILPVVTSINYQPNSNNRFSFILSPQGNYYKISAGAITIADTSLIAKKINLQTGSLKSGLSWSKKINTRFELYIETGTLIGNSITVANKDFTITENINPSGYFQIGLNITLNPNRLDMGIKRSNNNGNSSKKGFNPSLYNIERLYLD